MKNNQKLLSQIHKSNHSHPATFQQTIETQHLHGFKNTGIVEQKEKRKER